MSRSSKGIRRSFVMNAARRPEGHQESRRNARSQVGIIFLVNDKLFIESTSLETAGSYGAFLIHERSHEEFFEELGRAGSVDGEYDDWPRARVMYSIRLEKHTLLADRCILGREDLVQEVLHRFHLPADTIRDTDSHYRCPACLRRA